MTEVAVIIGAIISLIGMVVTAFLTYRAAVAKTHVEKTAAVLTTEQTERERMGQVATKLREDLVEAADRCLEQLAKMEEKLTATVDTMETSNRNLVRRLIEVENDNRILAMALVRNGIALPSRLSELTKRDLPDNGGDKK